MTEEEFFKWLRRTTREWQYRDISYEHTAEIYKHLLMTSDPVSTLQSLLQDVWMFGKEN